MNYFKKSRMLGLLLVILTMATAIVFVSCGNDDDEGDGVTHDKATITVYKNITLGACKNKWAFPKIEKWFYCKIV